MTLWTIRWLKRIESHRRLAWAVRLLYFSLIGGAISTAWVATTSYERILMGISWGAIAITAVDIVVSSDVRDEL